MFLGLWESPDKGLFFLLFKFSEHFILLSLFCVSLVEFLVGSNCKYPKRGTCLHLHPFDIAELYSLNGAGEWQNWGTA